MKSKLFLTGILSIMLVFGLVLTGCPNDTSEETDTWSAITDLAQLDGTWDGSYSETIKSGESLPSEMQIFKSMKVSVSAEISMSIDAAAKTQATSTTMTMVFSGGNIGLVWEAIKETIRESDPEATFDDAKHSVTMTQEQPAQEMSDAEIAEMRASVQK